MGKTVVIQEEVVKTFDAISNTYTREDLEDALDEFLNAGPDSTIFLGGKLQEICDKLSISKDSILKDRSLLSQVPDKETAIEKSLGSMVYALHGVTPSPAENMERIVRELASEYKADSVRLAILKKFILGSELNCNTIYTEDISRWAWNRMSAKQKREYITGSDQEKAKAVISVLSESIFDDLKDTGKLTAGDKLNVIIDQIAKFEAKYVFFDEADRRVKLSALCFDHEDIKPVLKDAGIQYRKKDTCYAVMRKLQRIEMLDSLIIEQVIKSFQKIMSGIYYIQNKGEAGKPARAWTLFDNALKDAKDKNRNGELIELCNDFANGVFKTDNGDIRKKLFRFAIIFDMTVKLKDEDERDEKRDIEKNLFEDYYCDNMMRFLSTDFSDRKTSSIYENEPTGEGINYKNYVEAIYVYYLYRKDLDLTRGERIDSAEKKIGQCFRAMKKVRSYSWAMEITEHPNLHEAKDLEKAKQIIDEFKAGVYQKYVEIYEHKKKSGEPDYQLTYVFKDRYAKIIGEIPEKNLVRYICRNFRILPSYQLTTDTTPKIQISAGEREAFSALNSILDSIYQQYSTVQNSNDTKKKKDNYESSENDEELKWANIPLIKSFVSDLSDILKKEYSDDDDFLRMVDQIEKRLRFEFEISGRARSQVLAAVLAIFFLNIGEKFTNENIKGRISSILSVNGVNINRCMRILKSLGYDINSETNKEEHKTFYWMGRNKYADEFLQQTLDVIKKYGGAHENSVDAIENLILIKNPKECKVTRSRLVAAKAIQFVTQTEFFDDSIPAIYETFKKELNETLDGTRYQKFNEKNIFDLYVFVSICICLLHNGVI